jgi:hypothetical protein
MQMESNTQTASETQPKTPAPKFDFEIEHFGGTETVSGRKTAVSMAKRLSREHGGRVHVEREDGRVYMQFRRGKLERFVHETRRRRRARR